MIVYSACCVMGYPWSNDLSCSSSLARAECLHCTWTKACFRCACTTLAGQTIASISCAEAQIHLHKRSWGPKPSSSKTCEKSEVCTLWRTPSLPKRATCVFNTKIYFQPWPKCFPPIVKKVRFAWSPWLEPNLLMDVRVNSAHVIMFGLLRTKRIPQDTIVKTVPA